MTIANEKVVTMHYHLTKADGQVIASSHGSDPLTYLHGAGTLLASLERALTGLDVGATTTVELAPAEAYGAHDANEEGNPPAERLCAGAQRRRRHALRGARRPRTEGHRPRHGDR